MNPGQFITGLLLVVLSAGLYFASRSRKAHAGQLSQAEALDLTQAAQGRLYGKFQGSIIADQQLTTPYSVRPAVTWSAHLERGTEESDEDGSTTNWDTVWSQSASTPFRLKGAGELWFDERGGLPTLDAPSTFDQYIHDATNPIIAPYVCQPRSARPPQQAELPCHRDVVRSRQPGILHRPGRGGQRVLGRSPRRGQGVQRPDVEERTAGPKPHEPCRHDLAGAQSDCAVAGILAIIISFSCHSCRFVADGPAIRPVSPISCTCSG